MNNKIREIEEERVEFNTHTHTKNSFELIHILKNTWVEVKEFFPWFAFPFIILFVAFLIFLLNLVGVDEGPDKVEF